jgi:hypothetical protein
MTNIFRKIDLWFWSKYRQFRRDHPKYCWFRVTMRYYWMRFLNGGKPIFRNVGEPE